VARFLSEIRKYGLGCVLSHQHLGQLQQGGLDLLDAVKSNTNCEIAYKRDPTCNAVHIIDHTRKFRTLVGSRFARDVTPPYCAFS
jgi:hypothetical protein